MGRRFPVAAGILAKTFGVVGRGFRLEGSLQSQHNPSNVSHGFYQVVANGQSSSQHLTGAMQMRFSTIFAALAFIPLPLKATDISGQVFIVTRGAETIKLALVPIVVYKKENVLAAVKAVDVEFTKAREKTANFVQAVHEAYKEADTARQRLSSEAKYQEANRISALASDLMRLEFSARRRSSFLNGSDIYFKELQRDHQVVATAKTDAEGKFTMKIPDDGEFALVASAHREVPDNIELYFWIVPAKQHTDLTNENLTSATGDSLLHVTGKDKSSDPSVTEATLQADLNKIKTAHADVFAAIANPPGHI